MDYCAILSGPNHSGFTVPYLLGNYKCLVEADNINNIVYISSIINQTKNYPVLQIDKYINEIPLNIQTESLLNFACTLVKICLQF